MATPMTTQQWIDALRAEGVHAAYMAGWMTAGRDSATGKTFGPVNGVMIHHTAGTNSLSIVKNGTGPDLPGPLAHAHLSKSGTLTQLSAHRCNHAGTIAQNAFDAVVSESSTHPRPDAEEPVDGNDHLYGIEIENKGDGVDLYPAIQYDQAVRWATAICRHHGWTANSVIGHKEGTRRKIDPSFSMDIFRAKVAERLAHPASWSPGQVSTPPKETPVQSEPVKPQAYRDVLETDAVPAPRNHPDYADGNVFWTVESHLRFQSEALVRIQKHLGLM